MRFKMILYVQPFKILSYEGFNCCNQASVKN